VPTPPAAPTPGRPFGTARTVGLKPASRFETPRWVMLRSLAIPGWGQVHNHAWIKAALVAAGEGALGYNLYHDWKDLDRLQLAVDAARQANDAQAELDAVTAYNDRQASFVARQWLLGGVVLYAMVDAYVDAHFRNFDVEFKHDPALPEGPPSRLQLRAAYRWSF